MYYNKLVRDRMPEIIANQGEKAIIGVMEDEEDLKWTAKQRLNIYRITLSKRIFSPNY